MAFTELSAAYADKGFEAILGCSKDTPALNKVFHDEQNFSFPLLSDVDGSLYAAFGVTGRATVVVVDGQIKEIISPFDARQGPADLLGRL